jgi:hypothetical protein
LLKEQEQEEQCDNTLQIQLFPEDFFVVQGFDVFLHLKKEIQMS